MSAPRNPPPLPPPGERERRIHMTPRSPQIVPKPPVLAALSQRRDGATCPVSIGPRQAGNRQ